MRKKVRITSFQWGGGLCDVYVVCFLYVVIYSLSLFSLHGQAQKHFVIFKLFFKFPTFPLRGFFCFVFFLKTCIKNRWRKHTYCVSGYRLLCPHLPVPLNPPLCLWLLLHLFPPLHPSSCLTFSVHFVLSSDVTEAQTRWLIIERMQYEEVFCVRLSKPTSLCTYCMGLCTVQARLRF